MGQLGKAVWGAAAMLSAIMLAIGTRAASVTQAASVVADLRGDDIGGIWDFAAIDRTTKRLLVARMAGVETVALVGRASAALLAPGRHVHAVLPLPGGRVLFTNGDGDTASIVEARGGRVLATLKTGARPDGAVFDPASGQVLVMDGRDGTITRLDVAAAPPRVVGTIAVGGGLEAPALDGRGRLFVNVEDRNEIAVVSLAGGRVTARYPLTDCDGPTGLAYDRAHRLLVSACTNAVAKVLRDDGREQASLAIGPHADAVIADPPRERVFIPCGGDGTLWEISLAGTPHVTRVLRTRAGARTGAYDPATQRLYLPYGAVVRVQGQPPKLVAGSFGILVVDVR